MTTPRRKYTLKKQDVSPTAPGNLQDSPFAKDLNEEQWQAASHGQGPQLILAGAGTGKTRTLMYRVAYLVAHGIPAAHILLLTFTRKAAKEMTLRAGAIAGKRCTGVQGHTFHSFANKTLRRFASYLGFSSQFSIADTSDSEDIIQHIRTRMGLHDKNRRFPQKATIHRILSKSRNTNMGIADVLAKHYPKYAAEADTLLEFAAEYAQYKKQQQIMDYDDLLHYVLELLQKHPECAAQLRREHPYVILDEYQDTNTVQAQIALELATATGNITAVGDDCQGIYSFRGADHRSIFEFPTLFPTCMQRKLQVNYRSTQQILNVGNAIMEQCSERFDKKLQAHNNKSGDLPVRLDFYTLHEQASFITQHILELREEGIPLNEIAVLFRSGHHSNELEIELSRQNIPFIKQGGIKFIEAAHIKDMICLLKCHFNPKDSIAWQRVLLLLEGVGAATAQKIITLMQTNQAAERVHSGLIDAQWSKKKYAKSLVGLHSYLEQACEVPHTEVTTLLELAQHFYRPVLENKYEDWEKRLPDLNTLLDISAHYKDLEAFLTELSLDPPERSGKSSVQEEDDEQLVLSTIHSAKGLEYKAVFVICLSEGYFPAPYAIEHQDSLDEECRLFHVAATRAKDYLYLLSPRAWDRSSDFFMDGAEASRMLEALPEHLYEQWELEIEDTQGEES